MLLMFMLFLNNAMAMSDLPLDYRTKTYPVDHPLELEYRFGPNPADRVTLAVVNYPGLRSDLFFFHLHINEDTSRTAGLDLVKKNGGTFMFLQHSSGKRRMFQKINGTLYNFDPNRVFTTTGLKNDIDPQINGRDLTELSKFVEWLKRNIRLGLGSRKRPMVTALHNNTDDDTMGEALSILTEKKILQIDNAAVNINPTWDIDNFYIATLKTSYDLLISAISPNISLRLPQPRDIGYLSNWMITEGIEYINVETQIGDYQHNLEMVEAIQDHFN